MALIKDFPHPFLPFKKKIKVFIIYYHLKIFFIQFLRVTFHLHLSQNVDYMPHVVQYILETILYPVVCISHFCTPMLPLLPSPPVTTGYIE